MTQKITKNKPTIIAALNALNNGIGDDAPVSILLTQMVERANKNREYARKFERWVVGDVDSPTDELRDLVVPFGPYYYGPKGFQAKVDRLDAAYLAVYMTSRYWVRYPRYR